MTWIILLINIKYLTNILNCAILRILKKTNKGVNMGLKKSDKVKLISQNNATIDFDLEYLYQPKNIHLEIYLEIDQLLYDILKIQDKLGLLIQKVGG